MVTIFLWAAVGGLGGLIFGVTAGLPGRMIVFVILLGAGAAAVPLVEAKMRARRKERSAKAGSVDVPPAFAKATAGAVPHPLSIAKEKNGEVLLPDEARQWLDNFLLKQQKKL